MLYNVCFGPFAAPIFGVIFELFQMGYCSGAKAVGFRGFHFAPSFLGLLYHNVCTIVNTIL